VKRARCRSNPGARDEGGFATIQYVLATGFSLVLLVLVANLMVDLYARGAVRDALDEGARAAVPLGATVADCETRARAVVAQLLGGRHQEDIRVRCRSDGNWIRAEARVRLRSWLPLVPDWRFELRAVARATR
jgi:hypothetical protein